MPRPQSYDHDEAIACACRAFWKHGYGALGVRALEQQTGLNKFAIRAKFGGKEGLYLAALTHYHEAARKTVLKPMYAGGLETLHAFFEGLVTKGSINSSAWGCLMVNTGVENAEIKSPALKEAADAYWAELAACFEMVLVRSDQAPPDVSDVARGLVTATIGIHTMNRVCGMHDAGRPLVRLVQNSLKQWGPRHGEPANI